MLCESCQKNPASVHLTDVSNNLKKEVHLCDECALAQGVTVKSYMHKPVAAGVESITPSEALAGAVESGSSSETQICPSCGTSYREFRSSGKFGCPHDYAVFKTKLDDLLEKIHGKNQHIGKVPARASDQIAKEEELHSLKHDLESAVRDEAYEKAADLRDRIHRIEGA